MLFYADENFPLDAVIELRRLGNDVGPLLKTDAQIRRFKTKKFCGGRRN